MCNELFVAGASLGDSRSGLSRALWVKNAYGHCGSRGVSEN